MPRVGDFSFDVAHTMLARLLSRAFKCIVEIVTRSDLTSSERPFNTNLIFGSLF